MPENTENRVQISFRVHRKLRNQFFGKVNALGLDATEILGRYVMEYVDTPDSIIQNVIPPHPPKEAGQHTQNQAGYLPAGKEWRERFKLAVSELSSLRDALPENTDPAPDPQNLAKKTKGLLARNKNPRGGTGGISGGKGSAGGGNKSGGTA